MNSSKFEHRSLKLARYVVKIVAVGAIIVAFLVLMGWFYNIDSLKTLLPQLASMKFNTAIGFGLLGFGLLLIRQRPKVSRLLSIVVVTLAILTLCQYALGWELGIDELFVKDTATAIANYPGRMSVVTAILFGSISISLTLTARRQLLPIAQGLSLVVAFVALFSLVGFVFNVQSLYLLGIFSSLALHTALTFMVIGIGIFLVYPQHGIAAWIFTPYAGSQMARRFLPFIIVIPLFMTWLSLKGQAAGLYTYEISETITVLSDILFFTGLTFWIARFLNAIDHQREQAMQSLKQVNDELELRVQARTADLEQVNQNLARHIQEQQRMEAERDQFFELSIDMLMIASFDGYFKFVSPAFERILGFSTDELLHQSSLDFIYPDDVVHLTAAMQQLEVGQSISNFQIRFICADGSLKWVEWTAYPIVEQELIYSVGRDITAKKEADDLLMAKIKEEQAFLVQLRELQDIMVELTNIDDLDAFYKQAVELGLNVLGFDRLGLLLHDPADDMVVGTYGTDRNGKIRSEYGVRIKSSDLTGILHRAFEDSGIVLDEDAELYSDREYIGRGWNAVAVLWSGSKRLGWLAADNGVQHRPMTPFQLEILSLYALSLGGLLAQKQIQNELEESEARYRSVVSTMSEGVILQAHDGTIQASNAAAEQILGLSVEQMMGLNSIDPRWRAIHEDGSPYPGEIHPTMLSLQTGQAYSNVVMGVHKPDDTLSWILINSQPIFHPQETEPYAVVASFTDITQRKLAQQREIDIAIEKERLALLSQFVQDLSHEFKTPLTIMKSSLFLMRRTDDLAYYKKKLDMIETQIDRINKLVDMIAILSRLDSNAAFTYSPYNFNQIIQNLHYDMNDQFISKNISFSLNLAENLPESSIDVSQMIQAIRHVLDNALRFTDSGGSVTVSTTHDEGNIVIQVQDTGIGIADDVLPYIFDRFYRQDIAHHTPGFGLGLTIAHIIVERHHGEITVETTVGEGSVFKIILPYH